MTDDDRRHFSRIPFDAEVTMSQGSELIKAELVDISLKGVLLQVNHDTKMTLGEDLALTLILDGGGVEIEMLTSVAHVDEQLLGLKCERIDLDSISHLRRLVELNIGDSALLDRELAALG